MFVVAADCSEAYASDYDGKGTILSLVNVTSFAHEFKSRVQVTFPKGSHKEEIFAGAYSQNCDVRLRTATAEVQMYPACYTYYLNPQAICGRRVGRDLGRRNPKRHVPWQV